MAQKITQKNDFYFDDCPICQAMKQAEEKGKELSSQELKEAFSRAKGKGAVVGGEEMN